MAVHAAAEAEADANVFCFGHSIGVAVKGLNGSRPRDDEVRRVKTVVSGTVTACRLNTFVTVP